MVAPFTRQKVFFVYNLDSDGQWFLVPYCYHEKYGNS